jgi:hypothetical protein
VPRLENRAATTEALLQLHFWPPKFSSAATFALLCKAQLYVIAHPLYLAMDGSYDLGHWSVEFANEHKNWASASYKTNQSVLQAYVLRTICTIPHSNTTLDPSSTGRKYVIDSVREKGPKC